MLYNIFPYYFTKGTISQKAVELKMCVLIFTTGFVWNFFSRKEMRARYDKKCLFV